jgi:hypothetical protein
MKDGDVLVAPQTASTALHSKHNELSQIFFNCAYYLGGGMPGNGERGDGEVDIYTK